MRGIPAGAIAGCERAQPDARRPALAALEQVGGLHVRERGIRPAQERVALARAQRQIGGPQLEQLPARAKPCDRQAGREAAHERQRGSRRDVGGQGRDRLGRVAGAEQVSVVDDENDVPGRAQPGCEPGQVRRPVLRPARGRGGAVGRSDAFECRGEPPEQDGRVVVGLVDREPCERTGVALGPLRRERRLAVAGRCRHGHERHRCRTQPVHKRRPRHRPGGRGGHANLCFGDVRRLGSRSPGARARHPFSMRARPSGFQSGRTTLFGWLAPHRSGTPTRAARRRAAGPSMHADRSAASRGR